MREFQSQFATEEACQDYLAACRWPNGFRCPRCGHARAYRMKAHRRWQCVACRYQVSLTAGTILHNTKTPLTVWFWAAYLTVTDTRGMSALLLQRQLGLRRYETAWMLLHKLRRAMVNVAREPLHGNVEIDDAWIGGPQAGLLGSRQLKGRRAALIVVAVEKRGTKSGRVRMAVIPDFKATTLTRFITQHVLPGSTIYTDGLKQFAGLPAAVSRTCHAPSRCAKTFAKAFPRSCRSRTGDRQSPTMADRHPPWCQSRSTSGLPGRVRVSA